MPGLTERWRVFARRVNVAVVDCAQLVPLIDAGAVLAQDSVSH